MSNYLNRVFKGVKSLENILNANHISTESTRISTTFFADELRATSILLKYTRPELMERILTVLNDSLKENYNDIHIKGNNITIKKTNFTNIRNVAISLADFCNNPSEFNFHYILGQANAIQVSATTGAGKTELIKKFIADLHQREIRIFTTKPEDFEGYNFVSDYSDDNLNFIEKLLKEWLDSSIELKQRIRTVLVFDEAYILFGGKEKRTKALAELVNKVLAMNRAYGLRIFFITQTPNKEALGDLNTSLISTKIVNISDIQNYSSTLGSIPSQIKIQILKTGEFYFFHRGEPVKILKYRMD